MAIWMSLAVIVLCFNTGRKQTSSLSLCLGTLLYYHYSTLQQRKSPLKLKICQGVVH